jgi:hypothetical protein
MAGEEFEGNSEPAGAGDEIGGPSIMPGREADRTAIAPVHDGEVAVPARDSQAAALSGEGSTGQPVTWSFPVEVEVVGELSEAQLQVVAKHVFDELNSALRGVG